MGDHIIGTTTAPRAENLRSYKTLHALPAACGSPVLLGDRRRFFEERPLSRSALRPQEAPWGALPHGPLFPVTVSDAWPCSGWGSRRAC